MRKPVTISLDDKIWKEFKIKCIQNDLVPSREIEKAIVSILVSSEDGNDGA